MFRKIPHEAIIRLSYYLRAFNYFREEKKEFVSSQELAEYLHLSADKIRKDLSYFGNFGKKGIGYPVEMVIEKLKNILGLDKKWYACVVGFGNLAKALCFYKGFKKQGIIIKIAFDIDEKKINKKFDELEVYHIKEMEKKIRENNIELAIIAVPKETAQEVAERLVKCGIKAILNFAPTRLNLPKEIVIKDVDLSCQLAFLTHYLKFHTKSKE
ncbi:redox-sensing transcriptional repressor Rex [Methanosarcinales archaeon]|nr:MAG: redox-sensing transcriptional repressor Rex [Methanosarcinales archaeon]